jgi:hypothetical protein
MSLIGNQGDIEVFANTILNLETYRDNYVFPIRVVQRRKYDETLNQDSRKIYQTMFIQQEGNAFQQIVSECNAVGSIHENTDAMVIYMFINPRQLLSAGCDIEKMLNKKLIKNVTERNDAMFSSLLDDINSALCKTEHVKRFSTIDVDDKKLYDEVYSSMMSMLCEPRMVIETRGGYHFIMECDDFKTHGRELYAMMASINRRENKMLVEFLRDPQTPIPGTYQGGFLVKIIHTRSQR